MSQCFSFCFLFFNYYYCYRDDYLRYLKKGNDKTVSIFLTSYEEHGHKLLRIIGILEKRVATREG